MVRHPFPFYPCETIGHAHQTMAIVNIVQRKATLDSPDWTHEGSNTSNMVSAVDSALVFTVDCAIFPIS